MSNNNHIEGTRGGYRLAAMPDRRGTFNQWAERLPFPDFELLTEWKRKNKSII